MLIIITIKINMNSFHSMNTNMRSSLYSAAQWTDWLPWGGCSESCGKGIQTRTRQCLDKDHVVVSDGECDGLSAETRDCICDMNFYAPGKGTLILLFT